MDHDAMLRDVQNLKKFRDRVENAIAFIEGLKAAGYKPPGDPGAVVPLTDDQVAEVRAQFEEIVKPVSAAMDAKLNGFDDRLKAIETVSGEAVQPKDVADLAEHVTSLQRAVDDLSALLAPGSWLMVMADWFEQNREGLEVLLSLDGEPDPVSEPPIPGAQDASGAGSTAAATEVAANPNASQAAPQA